MCDSRQPSDGADSEPAARSRSIPPMPDGCVHYNDAYCNELGEHIEDIEKRVDLEWPAKLEER